jgi:hypothetical protein
MGGCGAGFTTWRTGGGGGGGGGLVSTTIGLGAGGGFGITAGTGLGGGTACGGAGGAGCGNCANVTCVTWIACGTERGTKEVDIHTQRAVIALTKRTAMSKARENPNSRGSQEGNSPPADIDVTRRS